MGQLAEERRSGDGAMLSSRIRSPWLITVVPAPATKKRSRG